VCAGTRFPHTPFERGFFVFFDEVEKNKNPTRMGSVREPGSLTLPQVTPIEGNPAEGEKSIEW
jgi:hypothetical protein